MKKLLANILFVITATTACAQFEHAPAFPGAEGFGRFTSGGRGGKVLHVTSLADDSSEGTLRWACEQKGARTVVFDVDGTIYLKHRMHLVGDSISILGQTAPGDGICVADYPFTIGASNVIIRFVRFRLGDRYANRHQGDGLGGADQHDIVVDHCSVSWSTDECLSIYGSKDVSVQWNLVDQSLVNSGHVKGSHGYGAIWGGTDASFHHNLLAHHTSRVPRLGPRPGTQTEERMDMRNNVMYNWDGGGCYGGEGMTVNIVNNYYKPGPGTSEGVARRIASPGIRTTEYTRHDSSRPNQWDRMWHVWGKYFVEGNVNPAYADVTADNWTFGVYNQISEKGNDGTYTQATRDTIRLAAPMPYGHIRTQTAGDAYDVVVKYCGASFRRDSHDAYILKDVKEGMATYTGTGNRSGFINSQDDAGGWPVLTTAAMPEDTDRDGMPDAWEKSHGLNPSDASDANAFTLDSRLYYTNLEVYCNSLVEPIVKAGMSCADTTISGYFEEYFP